MKFKFIHRKTNMSFREFKNKYPLRYYFNDSLTENDNFQNVPLKCLIREDGALAFQRLNPWYDEGELYFLKREDWIIEFRS